MIVLTRETVAALVQAGNGLLPWLVEHDLHDPAWELGQALNAAESALLDDEREGEAVVE